jgi:hypothetical protein
VDGHSRPTAIKNIALVDTAMDAESLDDRSFIPVVPLPKASFRV